MHIITNSYVPPVLFIYENPNSSKLKNQYLDTYIVHYIPSKKLDLIRSVQNLKFNLTRKLLIMAEIQI
jgi:hypothetical protein